MNKTEDVKQLYEKKFGSTKSIVINDGMNRGLKRVPVLKKFSLSSLL